MKMSSGLIFDFRKIKYSNVCYVREMANGVIVVEN